MGNGPGLVVTGASGRMGQTLIRLAQATDKLHLVGCVERSGHPWIGRDVGDAMGGAPIG
ncbi:MAG: 4-hydroxy-tetrahydrodipicolinate reductase, partial [Pseudomonadota bacterium]